MIAWLQTNKQPLATVQDFMQKTATARATWIRLPPATGSTGTEKKSLATILQEYPRLMDPGMVRTLFLKLQQIRLCLKHTVRYQFLPVGYGIRKHQGGCANNTLFCEQTYVFVRL